MFIIYMYTLPNSKSYIGQTSRSLLQRSGYNFINYRASIAFYNAIKKYGAENITTAILCQCNTLAEANYKEQWYIKRFNTISPNGYNLRTGGGNSKPCPETRRRMSENHADFSGKNHPNFGKNLSAETRHKISKAHLGKKLSSEHRRKISENSATRQPKQRELRRLRMRGEKNPMYGKTGKASPNYGKKRPEHSEQMAGEKNPSHRKNRDKRRGQLQLF